MKLIFKGHDARYAVEQSLLAFFPRSGRCMTRRPRRRIGPPSPCPAAPNILHP